MPALHPQDLFLKYKELFEVNSTLFLTFSGAQETKLSHSVRDLLEHTVLILLGHDSILVCSDETAAAL